MKKILSIGILFAVILFSCKTENIIINPTGNPSQAIDSLKSLLSGKWLWDKSYGGIAYIEYTPEKSGFSQEFEFVKNDKFNFYKDGSNVKNDNFTISREKISGFADSSWVLKLGNGTDFGTGNKIMYIEPLSRVEIHGDTMELKPPGSDRIYSRLIKEKAVLPDTNGNRISFSNPKVGQTSIYIGFTGEDMYDNKNINFSYRTDTVSIKISEKNGNELKIIEISSIMDEYTHLRNIDSTWYYIKIDTDTIRVFDLSMRPGSYSQIFGAVFIFPLNVSENVKYNIRGWKTDSSYFSDLHIGYAENFTILSRFYSKAYLFANNKPMTYDGPGQTIIYSPDSGVIRAVSYGGFTSSKNGHGWDLK